MKCQEDNEIIIKKMKMLTDKLFSYNDDRFETDDVLYYENIKAQLRLCNEFLKEE